jgi:hypothetical protein
MAMANQTQPARRLASVGYWLTGGTTGSRHRDVQGCL